MAENRFESRFRTYTGNRINVLLLVYENGNIVRGETRDTTSTQLCWKLDWKTFNINGNGIKYAHADYER